MTLEFLLTALVVVMIPGTGAIYTIGCGLTRGRAAAMAASGAAKSCLANRASAVQ